jgi:threonine synthase
MAAVAALVCVKCGRRYGALEHLVCPDCGLDGILDVQYDYDRLRTSLRQQPLKARDQSDIFRYADLLPLEQTPPEMLKVGWTPLYRFASLGRAVGVENLFVKDDTVNPSGSLKDRASAVGIAMAIESGSAAVACASTGNAASSLAVLAASAGVASYIFVPETIPAAKLYQIGACASKVFRVKGTYENAFDVATDAVGRWGWYNRNCAINPYLVEGKKTCSLEVFEQLGYRVPDWVVVSVGDGCIISGQWKAFWELKMLGETAAFPKMLAVQASGCRPIVDAFHASADVSPVDACTLADSIRVGRPRNWRKALRAIRESGGSAVAVTDDEIVSAMLLLGRKAGIFAEPAGAAGFAGLRKAVQEGIIAKRETVVVLVTGSGLKDPASLEGHVDVADIEANADQVGAYLEGRDNG